MTVISVTARLHVGDTEPHLDNVVRCSSVKDAVKVIEAGKRALLPPDSWEMAEEVMRAIGVQREIAEDQIYFARTGSLTRPQ